MTRQAAILEMLDALADALGGIAGRARAPCGRPWFDAACGKLVDELASYAVLFDGDELSTDEIRRIAEVAIETLPRAFRDFGAALAQNLFDERSDSAGNSSWPPNHP